MVLPQSTFRFSYILRLHYPRRSLRRSANVKQIIHWGQNHLAAHTDHIFSTEEVACIHSEDLNDLAGKSKRSSHYVPFVAFKLLVLLYLDPSSVCNLLLCQILHNALLTQNIPFFYH